MSEIVIEVPDEIANRLADVGVLPEEARRYALHRLSLLAEERQAQIDRDAQVEEHGMTLDEIWSLAPEEPDAQSQSAVSAAKIQPFLTPLIEQIGRRPAMFVRHGTFSEAADLLWGYAAGFHEANQSSGPNGLKAFREWLAQKFWKSHRFPRNLVWSAYIEHFGADDTERFRLLQSLYEEFLQSQNVDSTPKP